MTVGTRLVMLSVALAVVAGIVQATTAAPGAQAPAASATAMRQLAYIKTSNAGQSDMFGLTLSLSGDGNTLAVAAPWEASAATGVNGDQTNNEAGQSGAAYVFVD